MLTISDQRNDAGSNAWVLEIAATCTGHRQITGVWLCGGAAATTKTVILPPAQKLQGPAGHGKFGIAERRANQAAQWYAL
jgi:hypothetical protein